MLQGELNNIRDEIMKFKVGAPARVGLVAPNAVEVPAGGTGLDPSSTNFFQVCPVSNARHVCHANPVLLILTKGARLCCCSLLSRNLLWPVVGTLVSRCNTLLSHTWPSLMVHILGNAQGKLPAVRAICLTQPATIQF